MEGNLGAIITVLLSGLMATLVTILWQKINNARTKKREIFETLMAHRYFIASEESVKAINSLEVIFYSNNNVRDALRAFLDETEKQPEQNPNIDDKYLRLLEEISKVLKYKTIRWDIIKRTYYPTGLCNKIDDEATLRAMQIQIAEDTIKTSSNNINKNQEEQIN